MTDLRKAAEMALKALENMSPDTDTLVEVEPHVWEYKSIVAIQALRQALGTEQEGCAQCGKQASKGWALYCVECVEGKREWVGLTHEERFLNDCRSPEEIEYAKAIEAKLKEKNGG